MDDRRNVAALAAGLVLVAAAVQARADSTPAASAADPSPDSAATATASGERAAFTSARLAINTMRPPSFSTAEHCSS